MTGHVFSSLFVFVLLSIWRCFGVMACSLFSGHALRLIVPSVALLLRCETCPRGSHAAFREV